MRTREVDGRVVFFILGPFVVLSVVFLVFRNEVVGVT
jgi:hypothetical protein